MSNFWKRLFGGSNTPAPKADYLAEAIAFESRKDYEQALNSLRLALREKQGDLMVMQNIAIVYTRMLQLEEAERTWERLLKSNPRLPAANYGLAFLLLRKGDLQGAQSHLTYFLQDAPANASRWVTHAQRTLDTLSGHLRGAQAAQHQSMPQHDESYAAAAH